MKSLCRVFLLSTFCVITNSVPTFAGEQYRIREPEITAEEKAHWSFRPLLRPKVPSIKETHYVRNPIDHFIQARLEAAGLQPSPAAGRTTLIRRLSFDLTGLPPTPAEVHAFVNDTSPNAYEKLVDRLLASPAYGERWAQHWLDLARFAETDGFEHDKVRPKAWRYRDWVIEVLNRDMPYDEFVRLQLAGDELKPDNNGSHVATGFLVSGPDMPDINLADERRHVVLNEMVGTVGSVFLGLTLECAQCHNHRFDPISQADFYRMRAMFTNALPKMKRNAQLPAMVRERGKREGKAHLMIRGDFRRRGPVVEPAFPRIVNADGAKVAKPKRDAQSSMRRAALARWLTRPDHPLTARVIVNRVWTHHFGRGLTNTPSDFGIMGDAPSHPRLLDWLATEFVRLDWRLKRLHRLMVTSAAYRRASRPSDASWSPAVAERARNDWKLALQRDPKNKMLARRNRLRLSGEAIRDAMLLLANRLNPRRGGPGVRPPLPKELVATLLRNQWVVSPDENDHRRRSIYIFARRNLRFPIFEAFDRPDGNASCSRRSQSTTAPQALILFNSKFSRDMADTLAASVLDTETNTSTQIRLCFQRVLSRSPTPAELRTSVAFLTEQSNGINRRAALADFCLALYNINEFVYVD